MKEFKNYFIYVGNAYPHKNLGKLVEAIALLNRKESENIGLAIVSARNVFTERLSKLVKKFKAENYVRILGFTADEKLTALLKNAQAFVSPALSEGFGLPGLEAMKAGTLVLCSEIPVFKEIYKENVVYFDPYDVNSLVETLQTALHMKLPERQTRIAKAEVFIKRYSWSKMAQETINVYQSCIGVRSSQ